MQLKTRANSLLVTGLLLLCAYGANRNVAVAGEPCEPAWEPAIGQPGFTSGAEALTVYNGDLIAAGSFNTAGGQTVNNIARWDGDQWHPFESGGQIGVDGSLGGAPVYSLTVYNGDLIVGGLFETAGGQTVNNIARWDGSEWHALTSGGQIGIGGAGGSIIGEAWDLTVYNGDLIVAGQFVTAGGQTMNNIARWDGAEWHPFVSDGVVGTTNYIESLAEYNSDLIAAGTFAAAGGQTMNHIARWDGAAWHPLESGDQIGVANLVRSIAVYNNSLFAGGIFSTAGGQTVNRIARWNGSEWHAVSVCDQVGVDAEVTALTAYDGDLIVSGHFDMAGGRMANHIAAWHGCPFRGACCVNGAAVQLFEDECAAAGGEFFGQEVSSEDIDCRPFCAGDLNGDGVVNVSDLLLLLTAWGMCP